MGVVGVSSTISSRRLLAVPLGERGLHTIPATSACSTHGGPYVLERFPDRIYSHGIDKRTDSLGLFDRVELRVLKSFQLVPDIEDPLTATLYVCYDFQATPWTRPRLPRWQVSLP